VFGACDKEVIHAEVEDRRGEQAEQADAVGGGIDPA